MKPFDAIIFDMDGVLVDSEEYIARAAIQMFREKGLEVKEEDFLPFVGTGEDRYLGGVAEKYGMDLQFPDAKERAYAIYDEITRGKLEPLPGVTRFIDRCRKEELKIAVATSADEAKMQINLREIGIPENTFDAVLNGLDVDKKKPNPEIFLKAAEKLGVDIKKCLVVEDAPKGVEAAHRAGAKCLAVMSGFSREELGEADWIVVDLTGYPEEIFK